MENGISRISIIPVRSEPSEKAELETQLLFGEHYTVLEHHPKGKWVKVSAEHDGYKGWIDTLQHTPISTEHFEHLNNTEFKISTDIHSSILFKKRMIQIVIGSILPITSNELFEVSEHFAFNGASKNLGEKQGFHFLKQISKKYLYAPYLWGGRTPFGIDCSGLTQQLFKLCGYSLQRNASQQYMQGEPIDSLQLALPGDLAFFGDDPTSVTHVGILFEDQDILHASGWVRLDKLDENGIYNEELSKYSHKLIGLKRILKT